jgi:hypothetical protein
MNFDPNDPAIQALIANAVAQALAQQQAQTFQAQTAQVQAQPQASVAPVQMVSNVPNTSPCPSNITLLQATLIDNGTKETREKYEQEYKMCMEVWTSPADQINLHQIDWKRNVVLIEYYHFSRKMDGWLSKGTISQEYFKTLGDLWKLSGQNHWFGMIGDKGDKKGSGPKGTRYYDHQFIRVELQNRGPKEILFLNNGELIHSTKFVSTDLKGNPLKHRYTAQARIDVSGEYYENWSTQ